MLPAEMEYEFAAPKNAEEIGKIRQQLNRVSEAERFKNSRRYPALLRYIVEETLQGRGEFLKERTIGVCVFGCPADYDTAENPVVRVTIAEVRRRLAQYYQEEGRDAEVRIELPSGHYMPRFLFPRHHATPGSKGPGTAAQEKPPASIGAVPTRLSFWHSRLALMGLLAVSCLLLLCACIAAGRWLYPSALSEFWRPVLEDHRTVIFCLPLGNNSGNSTASAAGILEPAGVSTGKAESHPAASDLESGTFQAYETLAQNLVFSDAIAVHSISAYLDSQRRDSTMRLAAAMTLEDLRGGPVILVGGIDNPWTLRTLASLPYRFAGTPEESYWIFDQKNPNPKEWAVNIKMRLADIKRDFAIIARFHNASTGKVEVVVAGIGMSATAAAGQFVADEQQLEGLRHRIGPGFRDHDFEAVLSTDVVNGIAGSPHIDAVRVW
jgi:hypothetical protein